MNFASATSLASLPSNLGFSSFGGNPIQPSSLSSANSTFNSNTLNIATAMGVSRPSMFAQQQQMAAAITTNIESARTKTGTYCTKACVNCKLRKRKCDGGKPMCSQCVKLSASRRPGTVCCVYDYSQSKKRGPKIGTVRKPRVKGEDSSKDAILPSGSTSVTATTPTVSSFPFASPSPHTSMLRARSVSYESIGVSNHGFAGSTSSSQPDFLAALNRSSSFSSASSFHPYGTLRSRSTSLDHIGLNLSSQPHSRSSSFSATDSDLFALPNKGTQGSFNSVSHTMQKRPSFGGGHLAAPCSMPDLSSCFNSETLLSLQRKLSGSLANNGGLYTPPQSLPQSSFLTMDPLSMGSLDLASSLPSSMASNGLLQGSLNSFAESSLGSFPTGEYLENAALANESDEFQSHNYGFEMRSSSTPDLSTSFLSNLSSSLIEMDHPLQPSDLSAGFPLSTSCPVNASPFASLSAASGLNLEPNFETPAFNEGFSFTPSQNGSEFGNLGNLQFQNNQSGNLEMVIRMLQQKTNMVSSSSL